MAIRRKKDITEAQSNKQLYLTEKKSELIDIEKFYVNGQIENLDQLVNLKKNELVTKINEFNERMMGREHNPYLVSNYFFKSLNPLTSIEPDYSAEKLAIVWDLYMYLIEQVNMNIAMLQPTISHFCKFAGISTNKFKTLRNSGSLEMQTLINKICDETFDSNVLLAQTKKLSNRSTELRVKVENEVQEKPHVNVNVNVNEEVDLSQIASRLNELSNFKSAKSKFNEPIEVDVHE